MAGWPETGKTTAQKAQKTEYNKTVNGKGFGRKKNDLLCFISWTARQGQLEHIRENMRTTIMNIPELSTGGVTTSNCWMLVNRSCDATSCRRFCGRTSTCMKWRGPTEEPTHKWWFLKYQSLYTGRKKSKSLNYKPLRVESYPPVWQNRDKCFLQIFYPGKKKRVRRSLRATILANLIQI